MKGGDVITGPELRDSGTCLHYHSGGLVTVDARRWQKIVFDLLEIRVADTARLYGDVRPAVPPHGGRLIMDAVLGQTGKLLV